MRTYILFFKYTSKASHVTVTSSFLSIQVTKLGKRAKYLYNAIYIGYMILRFDLWRQTFYSGYLSSF